MKRKSLGRNTGFCCLKLGKHDDLGSMTRKGHQNCCEMKLKIFRRVWVKEARKEIFWSKCAVISVIFVNETKTRTKMNRQSFTKTRTRTRNKWRTKTK